MINLDNICLLTLNINTVYIVSDVTIDGLTIHAEYANKLVSHKGKCDVIICLLQAKGKCPYCECPYKCGGRGVPFPIG